jgi:hypothetical protein
MRALAYYTAGQMDRAHGNKDSATRQDAQTLVDLLIPVVKGWCTDSALAITSDGVQIHGCMGFIEETGASQHLRDARITTIYEGTTGIQANDLIGRKLARDSGVAMKRLIAMMGDDIDTASAVAGHDDASLDSIATAQRTALRALSEATGWLLAAPAREAAAGAVPYLKLCGTVIAGWLMARTAHAQSPGLLTATRMPNSSMPSASRRITTRCTCCRKPVRCATPCCTARPPRWGCAMRSSEQLRHHASRAPGR